MLNNFRSEQNWRALLVDQMAHSGRLYYKVAFGVLRDAAAAEDACQQAILKALSKPQELRNDSSVRAWLVKVVVNESLAMRRRRKIEQRVIAERVQCPPLVTAKHGPWELRQAVLEAVEKLPESTRIVVVMRLLNGMTGGEVKEVLGCSDVSVSRELHRGMGLLREALEEWKNEERGASQVR